MHYNNLIRWSNPNDTPEHFKSHHNRSNLKTFTPFGRLISTAVQPVTSEPQLGHLGILATVEIKPQTDPGDYFTTAVTSNCHFPNFQTWNKLSRFNNMSILHLEIGEQRKNKGLRFISYCWMNKRPFAPSPTVDQPGHPRLPAGAMCHFKVHSSSPFWW